MGGGYISSATMNCLVLEPFYPAIFRCVITISAFDLSHKRTVSAIVRLYIIRR